MGRYEIQRVRGELHKELKIPAEELEAFNQHMRGTMLLDISPGKEYNGEQHFMIEE